MTERFVGIDVGARELHCAALDGSGTMLAHAVVPAHDAAALASWCAPAAVIAIDAPEAPSTAPHADREGLSPKFPAARVRRSPWGGPRLSLPPHARRARCGGRGPRQSPSCDLRPRRLPHLAAG